MPRWPSLRDLDAEAPLARPAKIRAVLPVPSPGLPKPLGYEVNKVARPLEPLPFPAWGSRPTRQLSTPLPSVVPAGAAVSRPLRLPQRVRVGQPARAPSDAAVLQDIELDKWVNRWVASLLPFAKTSILSSLGDLAEESLRNLLRAKAVNTLKKKDTQVGLCGVSMLLWVHCSPSLPGPMSWQIFSTVLQRHGAAVHRCSAD